MNPSSNSNHDNGDEDLLNKDDTVVIDSNNSSSAGAAAAVSNGDAHHDDDGVTTTNNDGAANDDSNNTDTAANDNNNNDNNNTAVATATAPPVNHPLLIGTLSYSSHEGSRRHQIRGNWKFEHSTTSTPQRFELLRNIPPDEDIKILPADGEYHGTFSLAWEVKNSKGKIKTKRKSVQESGVKLKFIKKEKDSNGNDTYTVTGTGLNEYGVFELNGTATKSELEDDPGYNIRLIKQYTVTNTPPASAITDKKKEEPAVKPNPTKLPAENVICLRGTLSRHTSENLSLGMGDVVHTISGDWAMGLNYILEKDKHKSRDNNKGGGGAVPSALGALNKFEYQHKCSGESTVFPLSGKYTGWFYVDADPLAAASTSTNNGHHNKTKVPERDVHLKFIENNEGYHNVEGKGSNMYGKYTISGVLDKDGTITLFRHFVMHKVKISSKKNVHKEAIDITPAPGLLSSSSRPEKSSALPDLSLENLPLSFDDVKSPDGSELIPVASPPSVYGAVSKGIFKITDDGHHSCMGNWAITFDQLSNGSSTSSFHFGIIPYIAEEDAKSMLERMESVGASRHDDRQKNGSNAIFPIDSARYRGSFKMKRGVSKYTTVRDEQVVLKFVKNISGSYNVYGKGTNAMGVYDIVGTLICQTATSGHLILYRVYPLEMAPGATTHASGKALVGSSTKAASTSKPSTNLTAPSASMLQRRESGRQVKVPLRLEEDDPDVLEKCRLLLKDLISKDLNSIFIAPVDPIALGIPTYFDVIHEPMDLGTIQSRLESGELTDPQEFIRLVRLVFENAILFNSTPDSIVAIAARSLASFFNNKVKSVERALEGGKGKNKPSQAELAKEAKKKSKRKSTEEGGGSDHRRMKLSEFMSESKTLMDSITQAASKKGGDTVPRAAFDQLLQLVQLQNDHMISLSRSIAKHSSSSNKNHSALTHSAPSFEITSPKKKKAKTEKQEKIAKPPSSPEFHAKQTPPVVNQEPLTLEEQETLSEDINNLPEFLLPGAMEIIRQADGVNDDDDEIDLDLDMLDIVTQRKLQHYISQNYKPKRKKGKKRKSAPSTQAPPPAPSPETEEKTSNIRPSGKSFFSMGQDDSDDDDDEPDTSKNQVQVETAAALDPFVDDDADVEEDDDIRAVDIAASWVANSSQDVKPEHENGDADNEEDDLWGAAKKEAEASKALEADRAKREEKMIAEANMSMKKRMEEAQAIGEEVRAKREEEAANEALRLKEQEKEAEDARNAAREKALQEVNDVKNTIDLDAQRELMRQYEQEFNDNDSAGASPSSDFGF